MRFGAAAQPPPGGWGRGPLTAGPQGWPCVGREHSQRLGTGGPSAGSNRRDSQRMEVKVELMQPRDDDALLTPSEVAAMFRVNPKTVTRWARAGKISAIRTLGGHRRFRESEIRQFLEQVEQTDQI